MKTWPLLVLCFMVNSSKALMESAHQEGTELAESLKSNALENIQVKIDKDRIPGFETANPPQAELSKQSDFKEAIQNALKESEAGQTFLEASDKRVRYKLDPKTDSLFLVPSETSIQKTLDIEEIDIKLEKDKPQLQTCEEGGEEVSYECYENREVIPQVPIKTTTLAVNHLNFEKNMESYTVQTRSGRWYRHGKWETRTKQNGWKVDLPKVITAFRTTFCRNFNPVDVNTGTRFNLDCSRIQSFKINNASSISESGSQLNIRLSSNVLNITLFHDTYEGEALDQWVSQCGEHEKLVEQGLCQYGERVLSQGAGSRNINGYSIFKDAWQYRQRYHCKMVKDECSALRTQGCHQVGSTCKEKRQDKCWLFEQTYECPSSKVQLSNTAVSGLFCLTGSCQDTSYQANQEMLEVMTRLSLLKEIQEDIKTQQALGSFEIFKGSHQGCSRNCLNFKDCCGGMNGWGVSTHLASCTESEKQLAKMRRASLCKMVGTYCTEKLMGKCIRKKTVFCCFGTRFSRLLQEQGRAQLGLSWGSPESPSCRGFTVEEVSKIDFSKLDMRELFNEVMQKYRAPQMEDIQKKTTKQLQENLKSLQPEKSGDKLISKTGVIIDKDKGL